MENKKNNITEIVFIIDRSGSMAGFEADTIGGFNSMLEKQRGQEGKVYVSTVLFSNYSEVIHDRVDISEVKNMTKEDYSAYGCTALLDAVGGAITHIGNIHKYARPEEVPEHTVFIITTDGMENASHNYTRSGVREMIKRQSEKYGWEFIFLAANIDAEDAADGLGIRRERAVNFAQDREGMHASYEAMNEAISCFRRAQKLDDGEWRKKLDKDNKRRGK